MLRRILVLAPHTDDAELGCGGTIARFIEEGSEVFVTAFSTAGETLPPGAPPDTLRNEFLHAMDKIGVDQQNLSVLSYRVRRFTYQRQEILEDMVTLRKRINPTLVIIPCAADSHQDHETVHGEANRAFANCSIWGYELPWNTTAFRADTFVVLQQSHIDTKWEALRQYASQMQLGRHYFSREFIEGLARVRGVQVKALLAEAFEALRMVW
ncbi:MAG: PIG-L family deacetylase [Candidatus Eremiobacteraeota bacterium]|nr:PIG-L family deacetylase [Candidatus Eremiobacteraeota bacterium]